jgi:hypothetical protein
LSLRRQRLSVTTTTLLPMLPAPAVAAEELEPASGTLE